VGAPKGQWGNSDAKPCHCWTSAGEGEGAMCSPGLFLEDLLIDISSREGKGSVGRGRAQNLEEVILGVRPGSSLDLVQAA